MNNRLKESNLVFYSIRRNVALKENTFIKLVLYKWRILLILLYRFDCLTPAKPYNQYLERIQREAVKWRTGQYEDYKNQLQLLNILPLPMFLQLISLLTHSKLFKENSEHVDLLEFNEQREGKRNSSIYKNEYKKTRTHIVYRTCRIGKRIDKEVKFLKTDGMKN